MISNPYTKEILDFEEINLCEGIELHDKVKELYNKYKGVCEKYLPSIFEADTQKHKYYVYAWYAKAETKRYFYVGKGTGSRYNHILNDIKKHKEGKQSIRFQRYSEIQNRWGIDYEILLNGLTEYEALIYEECTKLEFLKNGEFLLCYEGIPAEYAYDEAIGERATEPNLTKSRIFERYFEDYTVPHFDEISEDDLMSVYIYPYFLDICDTTVISDKEIILNWLTDKKAKIYKTVSKRTKSVIIQGTLRYDRYAEYRKKGKKIYSSKDVINYIKNEK